jgi:hypothetical protein
MVLEWIRRRNGDFAGHLKTYLFTDRPIVGIERAMDAEAAESGGSGGAPSGGAPSGGGSTSGTTIGSLKGRR